MSRRRRLATSLGLILLLLAAASSQNPYAEERAPLERVPLDGDRASGLRLSPARVSVVDFSRIARAQAEQQRLASDSSDPNPAPNVVSPIPSLNFAGLDDIPIIGDGSSVIPPDTHGSVGPTRILTTLNNNYRVLSKADGTEISTVSIDAFWASTGAVGPFDPRSLYDPYQQRFIATAVSDDRTTSSSLLVAVSTSSDPAGSWTLARYQLGPTACVGGVSCWADYPTLGFNQSWIAISVNMFALGGGFRESRVNVFNYATFRAGAPPTANVFVTSDFTVHPVQTYSSTETTLYAPVHLESASARYRLNTITGPVDAPVYSTGSEKSHTLIGSWSIPGTPGAPQGSNPSGAASETIDPGDARIINAVFRNNAVWYAQTVGLPAGGSYTHTAAQWIKLDTAGNDLDAGRVEDTTATSTNGGNWYAYPSITVNANNDVLLGFSQFSSAQYPSAAYAVRAGSDPAGTMRDPIVVKAGIGYYYKTFGGTRNRWGDFSAAQVDPDDDLSMWTVQEYSKAQVGTTSYWGTWWAKVGPLSNPVMALDIPSSNSTLPQPFTLAGWAVDRGGVDGTGVDTVHVWAYPASGAPVFAGVATYGTSRPDVGSVFGARFASSGFTLSVSGLAPGTYTLVAAAHSTVAGSFNQSQSTVVTIPSSLPAMSLDAPANGTTVGTAFTVAGWAVDRVASADPGVDAIHVYAFPQTGTGFGLGIFLGAATLGVSRTDVGAVFGSQFNSSGFSLQVSSLAAGTYRVVAYARSSIAGTFNQSRFADVTVAAPAANPQMSLDGPTDNSTISQPFLAGGWAVDLGATSGTGVDAIHVWAFPIVNGVVDTANPQFVAQGTGEGSRPDVGAVFGERFTNSGYTFVANSLAAGQYVLGVYARSTVTGTFNQQRFVTITIQQNPGP